jgi:hypothetical protein
MYIMMRVLLILCIIAASTVAADAQSFYLGWLCINSGGSSQMHSEGYSAMITCAQPVAGACESSGYRLHIGFWQPLIANALDVELIESEVLPTDFQLGQNFPNPFNPSTTITFAIPRGNWVRLSVHNCLGQFVTDLTNRYLGPGSYRVAWDGRDESGNAVASGIYFYKLQSGSQVETKKMMLLK